MKKIILILMLFMFWLAGQALALKTYEAVDVGNSWVEIDPTVDGFTYVNIQNLSNIPMRYTTDNTIINPPEMTYREVRSGIDVTIYIKSSDPSRTGKIAIERY